MNLLYLVLLAGLVHASNWFSHEPDYARWSDAELHTWLEERSIKVPSSFDRSHLHDLVDANWQSLPSAFPSHVESGRQWSFDQYNRAQHAFEHIKDDTFDKWDESRLRAFLLEQGVVAPSGPREQLVLLAKNKYRGYTDAASYYSSLASASASSAYAGATEAAHSASQCISSAAAQATHEVTRAFDDTKDYVYSAWDDNRLRTWLEDHGVVEAKSANTRDELKRLADDYYRKSTTAIWESWSDSYMREWLIAHNLLKPTETLSRPSLLEEMRKYYYRCADKVWDTWSDSELKSWLIDHCFLKSDTQRHRDELVKMIEEHHNSISENVWGAWSDSDIRGWLSEHGQLEGRSEIKNRGDLVDLIHSKCPDTSAKAASYLVWPDARLRAYLRERGISESAIPTSRPGLLRETRIRWVQTTSRTENMFTKLKEILNNSMEAAEEKVAHVLEVLSGYSPEHKVDRARERADSEEARQFAKEGYETVKRASEDSNWGRGDEL